MCKNIKEFAGRKVDIRNITKNFTNKDGSIKNPRNLIDTEVIEFKWMDISQWKITDPRLTNIGVRSNQGFDETAQIQKISQLAFDFKENGWDETDFPPAVEPNSEITDDGRSRISAAIKNKEKWIPTAVVASQNLPSRFANGLRANNHKVSGKVTMHDVISTTVGLVENYDPNNPEQGVENNKPAIQKYLYGKVGIDKMFAKHICTQIELQIDGLLDATVPQVFCQDTDYWKSYMGDWLKINSHLDIDDPNDIILFKAGGTSAQKIWINNVMPKYLDGKPIHIVLYVNERNSDKARALIKDTLSKLEEMHNDTFKLVNKSVGDMITIPVPDEKLYTVDGVIPQVINAKHETLRGEYMLIQPEDY
jgi:hypothetical protein